MAPTLLAPDLWARGCGLSGPQGESRQVRVGLGRGREVASPQDGESWEPGSWERPPVVGGAPCGRGGGILGEKWGEPGGVWGGHGRRDLLPARGLGDGRHLRQSHLGVGVSSSSLATVRR